MLAMTAVLLVTMVLYPQSLAVLSLVLAMWVYLYAIRTTPIVVNGTAIDGPTKMIACSSITMLVVFFLTVRRGAPLPRAAPRGPARRPPRRLTPRPPPPPRRAPQDVGGLLLYAFTFGCIIIIVHGAFRVPDDLFVDDAEMNSSFFSMPVATAV